MDYTPYLETALRAASAARGVLARFRTEPLDVKTKGQHYNLVTAADVAVEDAIVATVRAAHPDHNIIAEEKDYGKTGSPFTWVIDPIDGTANFAHRFPHFAVSIALAHEGRLAAGVVLDPSRDELFQAVREGGAFLNGERLAVSPAAGLRESLLVTGFPYDRSRAVDATLVKVRSFFKLGAIDIRRSGSAALDLAWLAAGRTDGYFEYSLNAWDFAAGALILSEAGGRLSDWQGRPLPLARTSIAASNGRIHEALLEVLRGTAEGDGKNE